MIEMIGTIEGTKINVVDEIMGAGKTWSIINHINQADEEERFLIVTPYLDEVDRYRKYCSDKNFKSPLFGYNKTKLSDIKTLIGKGENIVSTHALFQRFDEEVIDLCGLYNYTLIMDEVANVVEEYALSYKDSQTLLTTYVDIDDTTKRLKWKDSQMDYTGKFDDEKCLCEIGSLVSYGDGIIIQMFPIEVFCAFKNVFILTYRFDLQFQKYYYDYFGMNYEYWSVDGDKPDNYHLVSYENNKAYFDRDYKSLIHIYEGEKMNRIGNKNSDLSKSWYDRNKNNIIMDVLQANIYNFFRNIRHASTEDTMWTTFKDYQNLLKGKGYTKGFLPLNARATNEFRNRTSVAYPINRYMNPFVKNFFLVNNITVDEDGFALSEMLQFIWRSAIREGKEIWVYIPSSRMRGLLEDWLNDGRS